MTSDLERDHEQLLEFLYACPVGLVEFDRTGAVRMINPHAMKHLLPLTGMRDPGNLFSILEACAPELRNLLDDFAVDRGKVCDGHRIAVDIGIGHDGKEAKVLACTMIKLGPDRMIATFSDITRQVVQERKLKQAEAWFASMVNSVNDYAVLSITPEGIIDGVNDAFTRQIGIVCHDALGRSLDDILNADAASGTLSLSNQLRLAERDGWSMDESWQERSTGERYWCQRLFAARTGGNAATPLGYSVVLRDVSRDESDVVDLRRMLTCDHLTGAANRTQFLKLFDREIRRWCDDRQPVSLILLDIDHFKAVNDAYGHPVGDFVLTQLTKVAIATLRPSDLFARIGGEEFAVLVPGSKLDETVSIADRLREAIAALVVTTDHGPLRITASFGCATAEDDCASVKRLTKAADDRLYAAKRAGRNRVCSQLPASTAA